MLPSKPCESKYQLSFPIQKQSSSQRGQIDTQVLPLLIKNISPEFHDDNQVLFLKEFRTNIRLKKNSKNTYVLCTHTKINN